MRDTKKRSEKEKDSRGINRVDTWDDSTIGETRTFWKKKTEDGTQEKQAKSAKS